MPLNKTTLLIRSLGQAGIFAAGALWGVYYHARIDDPFWDMISGSGCIWLALVISIMVSIARVGNKPDTHA